MASESRLDCSTIFTFVFYLEKTVDKSKIICLRSFKAYWFQLHPLVLFTGTNGHWEGTHRDLCVADCDILIM